MALSDRAVDAAKSAEKPYRIFDANGLYPEVSTGASKYWRMKYRYAGKEKRLAFGVYPIVTLKMARSRRDEARRMLSEGVDPGEYKKIARASQIAMAENSFESVALEWLLRQKPMWAYSHWSKIDALLKRDLFPWLGSRPIALITPVELLASSRRIEKRGAMETTKRARIVASQVFRYGVATGRVERDIAPDLRGAIAPAVKKHLAAITDPAEVGPVLVAIEHYVGTPVVLAGTNAFNANNANPYGRIIQVRLSKAF
jgi:hypothetical protein